MELVNKMDNINDVFNNADLYTKEVFKIFKHNKELYELDEEELARFNNYIGYDKEKIVTFCHKCKKEFPFQIVKKYISFENDLLYKSYFIPISRGDNVAGRLDIVKGKIIGALPPYSENSLYENQIGYIEYSFTCKNDSSHVYLMILSIEFRKGEFVVRKVGQNPSMLTIKGFDFDKYEKQLERFNAYDDYKKADLSNADHFFVGAFAYLRRIFEKLINYYINKYDLKLNDNKTETKIDAVKPYFDPRIKNLLKNLYEILSYSIHELDENESKDYYSYLKAIIDMQLEFEFTEEEKQEQSAKLSSVISKIENELKNRKKNK